MALLIKKTSDEIYDVAEYTPVMCKRRFYAMLLCVIMYTLISIHQANGAVSCAELKQNGDLTSGIKTINPEEIGATGDVEVECEMNSDPNDAITIIHNQEGRRLAHGSSYADPGSWSHPVTYSGYTMEQIYQLIKKSASCEQFIKFEGHGSLQRFENTNPNTWWVSRDDENMYMWGGGKTYIRACGCFLNGTCEETPNGRCNCDKNDRRLRTDSGFLTDRGRLPVTRIHIGDVDKTFEYAYNTVGPLRCKGFAPPALRSCAEVKAAGFTKTDSYLLNSDGDGGDNAYWGYCDFDLFEDEVTTVVFHNIPYRTHIQGYTSGPVREQVFTYWATDTQISTLTSESTECEQYFNIDVLGAALGSSKWVTIAGDTCKNWGGPPDLERGCPCAFDGTCYNGLDCNGFANDNTWREDAGYITDKDKLPLKKIIIGDVDSDSEEVYYRIGPLECKGNSQSTLTRGTSCYKVKTEAVTWKDAVQACRNMGAHLVTIDDNAEDVYLSKLAQSITGPMSSLWSGAECTPVGTSVSGSCALKLGYICESKVTEVNRFECAGVDLSPSESSILSSTNTISSGMCTLYCEQTSNCNSFSYNSDTHDCKMSSETTDSSAVAEDGFHLFIIMTLHQICGMQR